MKTRLEFRAECDKLCIEYIRKKHNLIMGAVKRV